jgi:hypothetical protein
MDICRLCRVGETTKNNDYSSGTEYTYVDYCQKLMTISVFAYIAPVVL